MSDKDPWASMRRLLGLSPRKAVGADACLYRLIADSSAYWESLEDQDGRMLWVSPSCEPITGHSPGDFLKDPGLLLAIVHPEDRALFEAHRNECLLSGDIDEAEFRIVRPDGGVRWIGHRCQPMRLPEGASAGRRSSNREITKRKKAEGDLQRRNRTLRAMSDSNQSRVRATVESDLLEDVCRIVVEDCGHAMVWIGYAEENEEKTVRPVAHAGFEEGYLEALNITWADTERGRGPTGTAIRTGEPAECRNMLSDPRFAPWREEALKRGFASCIAFPLTTDGKVLGAITIYAREPDPFSDDDVKLLAELAGDLSFGIVSIRGRRAQAAAELELRESEERYRNLFESMDEGFAACEMIYDEAGNPSDFRYLAVNPAFARLTGLPVERVVGRTVKEVMQSVEPSWLETCGRVLQSGQSERLEIRVVELGKHYEVFAWRSDIDRIALVFTDATQRKQVEAQLRLLNETLEKRVAERTAEAEQRAAQLKALAFELSQAERSERLVLANAIHEHLQQILVAAKLNLDALQARFGDEKLRSDVLRVSELLDESLTWCRSVTVSLSPPVLQESGLAGGLAWLARQMHERHGVKVSLSVCDAWVEPADADLTAFLFEAVRELLFNVVWHSGVLAARVAVRREDGRLEIVVEDDGKGFDPGILRERAQQPARFGLFSIQQRLEMIGGSMSVESAPGHGTRVALRVLSGPVPAKAEAVAGQPAVVRNGAPGPATARSGRVRVVIADDHAIFRQGFRTLLRAEGWIDVVGEAADGGEAVELARALRPDVIVMDVSMPKMSGIEATRQIVAELPGVRVVGLSMHEDEEIAASMREAGAVDFVTKGGPSDAAITAIYAAHFGGKKP